MTYNSITQFSERLLKEYLESIANIGDVPEAQDDYLWNVCLMVLADIQGFPDFGSYRMLESRPITFKQIKDMFMMLKLSTREKEYHLYYEMIECLDFDKAFSDRLSHLMKKYNRAKIAFYNTLLPFDTNLSPSDIRKNDLFTFGHR